MLSCVSHARQAVPVLTCLPSVTSYKRDPLPCAESAAQQEQGGLYLQGTPSAEQQQDQAAASQHAQQAEQSPRPDPSDTDPSNSAQPQPHAEGPSAPTGHPSGGSGMSLQPPSLPSHFAEPRPHELSHAQLLAQAQQATAGSPREGGGDPKQAAPKPPLAPGSKSVPQVRHSVLTSDCQ